MALLSADETLFRDIEVFDPDYMPEQFTHRNAQLSALAGCIKTALRGSRPVNALLVGPPATGKTTSIKITLQQLEEHSKRVVAVYVNCSIMPSAFRIFSEIHRKVIGYLPSETGTPLTKIYDVIFGKLQKEKRVLLVALDDIMFPTDVLYSILRAHEMYNVQTGIFVAGTKNELHKLDDKTRSIFSPQEIRFPVYTQKEIFSILADRAVAGLYTRVISDMLVNKIAEAASEKDLRFAIELLKQTALEAEKDGARKITDAHLSQTLGKMTGAKEIDLSSSEKELLDMIGGETMKSGQLFGIFNEKTKASYSTFYRLLDRLEKLGAIKTIDVEKGGKTRLISRS